jgi:hypothetical protein
MKSTALIASGLLLLAGCTRPPATASTDVDTKPAEAPAAHTFPADFKLDTPIPAAAIKTDMALVGVPHYDSKADVLLFDVRVTNSGTIPLVSAGKAPVQLAVNLAGPEGVDTAPGKRLVGRAMVPLIQPGSTGVAKVHLPADAALGQIVRVELFQEGVGWFGRRYNQPTLDIGTFERCKAAARSLCDTSGSPVAPQATAPTAAE